jgi:hypothetical protein
MKRHAAIATAQMDRELAFRETSDLTCLCGETDLACDMSRIHILAVIKTLFWFVESMVFGGSTVTLMSRDPPMPEFAVFDLPWNAGTIAIQCDIDHITKEITKGAHGSRKLAEIEQ